MAVGHPDAECTHRPAEVVRVHREIGHRLVNVPVLREAVRLADLAAVAVAVRPVLTFDERGVDLVAYQGRRQGCRHGRYRGRRPPGSLLSPPGLFPVSYAPWRSSTRVEAHGKALGVGPASQFAVG